MTSLLEKRYRRVLRLLPASYRAQWEDDMVATFLDSAYAADPDDAEGVELGSPSRSELASIVALTVRLRLGGTDAPPRSFVWGEAVRRVALVGLLVYAIFAMVGVAFNAWITAGLPFVTVPADLQPYAVDGWRALWIVVPLAWIPTYFCLVYGHWRLARRLALLAFAADLIANAVDLANNGPFTVARAYALAFAALPVLALAAYHQTAPPVASRPWSLALPIGFVPVFAAILVSQRVPEQYPFLDWAGMWCVGVAVGAVVWLVLSVRRRVDGPQWPLALAILATATLGLRLTSMSAYLAQSVVTPSHGAIVVVDVVECGLVLGIAVALASYAIRAWRRLPEGVWRITPGDPTS
jgi:hypothetical protein